MAPVDWQLGLPEEERKVMHFVAEKSWEVDSTIFDIFGGPETRRFPAMELSLNINVLLVDISVEDQDGETVTRRFFFTDLNNALNFVKQEGVVGSSIALLTRRSVNDGSYSVSDVVEIYEARDEFEQLVYVYNCSDGRTYFGPLFGGSEGDLTDSMCIYSKGEKSG